MTDLMERATLTAPDISCGHCELTIKEEVGALDGVASVEPSANTKLVTVTFDPARVSLAIKCCIAAANAAMDEAGYPVKR